MQNIEERAYSIREAKQVLGGIGNEKLYSYINNGRLRAIKMGNRTLILASDINNFLKTLPEYTPLKSQ